jgi:hypothetical protein
VFCKVATFKLNYWQRLKIKFFFIETVKTKGLLRTKWEFKVLSNIFSFDENCYCLHGLARSIAIITKVWYVALLWDISIEIVLTKFLSLTLVTIIFTYVLCWFFSDVCYTIVTCVEDWRYWGYEATPVHSRCAICKCKEMNLSVSFQHSMQLISLAHCFISFCRS